MTNILSRSKRFLFHFHVSSVLVFLSHVLRPRTDGVSVDVSGVTMGWGQDGQSPAGPRVQRPQSSTPKNVHVGDRLTDSQMLGCELHKNALPTRTPPGQRYSAPPATGLSLAQT